MADRFGRTLLHRVATSGNPESIKHVINIYPVHLHIQILNVRDMQGKLCCITLLDHAIQSQFKPFSTFIPKHRNAYKHYILDLLPESHLLQALEMQTNIGETVLHIAADLGHSESLKEILALFPESQRLRVLSLQTEDGKAVLHCAAESEHAIQVIMDLLPGHQRLQLVCIGDFVGEIVLHYAANLDHFQSVCHILEALPETQLWQVVNLQDEDGRTCLDLVQDEEALRCIMEVLSPPEDVIRPDLQPENCS